MPKDSPYSSIAEQVDLSGALLEVKRNDLLPPRPDDKAGGQVGVRFVEALRRSLAVGNYEPTAALIVPVSKPKYATRPAALMTLADRVVFEALVAPLRGRIDKGLVPDTVLLWPRGTRGDKDWAKFEEAPLRTTATYVVRTDVSGFYESIDHELLTGSLIRLTGRTQLVEALIDFLGRVMDGPRGLPQGIDTSDALATAYLSEIDSKVLREVPYYWRNGDDIRMGVDGHDAGRRAIHHLERQLRSMRLLLNADKTKVLHRDTYERQTRSVEEKRQARRKRIWEDRESALPTTPEDELIDLTTRAGVAEEIQWDIFYHNSIGIESIADQLRPYLEPSQVDVALEMFEDAMSKAPGSDGEDLLSDEEFHAIITSSMTVLLAAHNATPTFYAKRLTRQFPEKVANVAGYLRGVASRHPVQVAAAATSSLTDGYVIGLHKAWLLTVFRTIARAHPDTDISAGVEAAMSIAADEDESWLARAEAARLLAEVGELTHDQLRRLWNRAPAVVHADLVAAVAVTAGNNEAVWAQAFKDSLNADPVMQVVIQGLANTN